MTVTSHGDGPVAELEDRCGDEDGGRGVLKRCTDVRTGRGQDAGVGSVTTGRGLALPELGTLCAVSAELPWWSWPRHAHSACPRPCAHPCPPWGPRCVAEGLAVPLAGCFHGVWPRAAHRPRTQSPVKQMTKPLSGALGVAGPSNPGCSGTSGSGSAWWVSEPLVTGLFVFVSVYRKRKWPRGCRAGSPVWECSGAPALFSGPFLGHPLFPFLVLILFYLFITYELCKLP